jgi:hypothetical protein
VTMVLNFLYPEDSAGGVLVTMVFNLASANNIVVRGPCDRGS